jgi:hypothetical protein
MLGILIPHLADHFIGTGEGGLMHWLMLGLGGALVILAALLKLIGGSSDLQQHALPFWAFLTGIAGLFLGGWQRDKAKVHAVGHAVMATGMGSVSSHGAAAAGAVLATAPAMVATNSLSSLQRPGMSAAPAALAVALPSAFASDDIMARIRGLEAENDVLRGFLLEAKAAMSR